MQQFDCVGPAESCAGEVLLKITRRMEGNAHILDAELQDRTFGLPDRMSRVRHILPLKIDLPVGEKGVASINGELEPGQHNVLYYMGYWQGDLQYDATFEGMLEASESGAVFVFVAINWKANSDEANSE